MPGDLLGKMRRGWECKADEVELARLLASLRERKKAGTLHMGVNIQPEEEYSHSFLGKKLDDVLRTAASAGPGGSRPSNAAHGVADRTDSRRPKAGPGAIVSS